MNTQDKEEVKIVTNALCVVVILVSVGIIIGENFGHGLQVAQGALIGALVIFMLNNLFN